MVTPTMESLKTSLQIFQNRSYRLFWAEGFAATLATMMQSVTLGWQVYTIARESYSIEHSSFLVGMVGLVQFLPLFALALVAGAVADHHDRRKIMLCSVALQLFCSVALAATTLTGVATLPIIFSIAALYGTARAFLRPATSAMGPMLVEPKLQPRAIAWNSINFQTGAVLGPWIGGLLCAYSSGISYCVSGTLYILAGIAIYNISGNTKPKPSALSRVAMIKEGLDYVWNNKIVFGAISLDLFAVLLGGVTALLPVYARDILQIGPDGFGFLRSGPAIGGGIMAVTLSIKPIQRYAGPWMLGAVAVYGCATLGFAVSTNLILSMIALIILGAADVISVFVRQTLVQIVTPDHMRGRVSAVSSIFISASNELGEFESGTAARFFGPVGSAIFGGVGSLIVVSVWSKLFPALRKADKLEHSNS